MLPVIVYPWSYQKSQIKDLLLVGMVLTGIIGWLLDQRRARRLQLRFSLLELVFAANALIWVASLLLSRFPREGVEPLSLRLCGLLLLCLMASGMFARQSLLAMVRNLLAASLVMSTYGILQFFELDPFLTTEGLVGHFRVSSFTPHPNIFISFLVAVVPLNIAAFRLLKPTRITRTLLGGVLLVNLGAAAATMSRAGLASLVGAVGCTLVAIHLGDRAARRRGEAPASRGPGLRLALLISTAGLLLVGALAFFLTHLGGVAPEEERRRFLSVKGESVQKRALYYQAALEMGANAPFLGLGPGTFALYLPEFRSRSLARFFPRNEYQVEHTASEPLELLAESGGLGLLGWLALVGLLVGFPLRQVGRIEDPGLRALVAAAAAGTLGLLAHGLVEVNLRLQPSFFMFWALAGLALAACRAAGVSARTRWIVHLASWPGRIAAGGAMASLLVASLVVILQDFRSNIEVHNGSCAVYFRQPGRAERAYREAVALWPQNHTARYRHAHVLWKIGRLEEAREAYRSLMLRSPSFYSSSYNMAVLLWKAGDLEEAMRYARRAIRINPFHVPSHGIAVSLALKLDRVRWAEQVARQIYNAAPYDKRSKLPLAKVKYHQGRLSEAIKIMSRPTPPRKRRQRKMVIDFCRRP